MELPPIPMMHSKSEEEPLSTIGEATPIRLGLILTVLGIVGAGIIGSAVWAATQFAELKADVRSMQGTLNTVALSSSTMRDDLNSHKTEDSRQWSDIKERVSLLERSGSQAVRDLAKDLNDLKNDFRVHEALSKQPGGKP